MAAEALNEYCVRIRRHLHSEPEISFREFKTTDYICAELDKLSVPYRRTGATGLIAWLGDAKKGAHIGFRADIDALAMEEENDVPYRSRNSGVMHACGHDCHAAILLGLIRSLSGRRERISGLLTFVFQPAEELPPGMAVEMVKQEELRGMDAFFGLHVAAELPVGTAGVCSGPFATSVDKFTVTLYGAGGHPTSPQLCRDPIVCACALGTAWQTIVSRNVDPQQPAVVSVCGLNSGSCFNVTPEKAVIIGNIRAYSEATRAVIERRFRTITENLCSAYEITAQIDYQSYYPVLINDKSLNEEVRAAAAAALGDANVIDIDPLMGSDDFAYYGQLCPIEYFIIGAGNEEKGIAHASHSSRFDVDESAMELAVGVLLRLLSGRSVISEIL